MKRIEKNSRKSVKVLLIMLLCAVFLFRDGKTEVQAAGKPMAETEMTIDYNPLEPGKCWNVLQEELKKTDKVTSLKSSNSKVARISKFYYGKQMYIMVEPRKAGKATVSFKLKRGNKTYSYKIKVTVYNYQSPCKTFKIGQKSYTSSFKQLDTVYINKKVSGKLNIKPVAGWEISTIDVFNSADGGNNKMLKPTSKVTVGKNRVLQVMFYQKKTGLYRSLFIRYM